MISKRRWQWGEHDNHAYWRAHPDVGRWRTFTWTLTLWWGWENWLLGVRAFTDTRQHHVELHIGPAMLSITHESPSRGD